MLKRILVALSGTPYTTIAVQHAIELAKRHEAQLTGVTITNLAAVSNVGPIPIGAGAAAAELVHQRQEVTEERVEKAIAGFEASCEQAGMIHSVVHEAGDPFQELISLWRYHDLTIFGMRGIFEYGIVHHPDDYIIQLIRSGVRPILAVSDEHHEVRKVLIAYDGSMHAAKAMKKFVQMRLWNDLQCKVVCFDKKPERAEILLVDAVNYCHVHGLDAHAECVEANAKEDLLEHAQAWGADLIVMGSSAKSRMTRFVLGDVCLNTIRQAHVPLFLNS
ncbi:MAG: universal stress protein [Planctomycetota bacterium]|nr:universal stress protein [Planctomycetota bacterium]